jgi:hypothetical protein
MSHDTLVEMFQFLQRHGAHLDVAETIGRQIGKAVVVEDRNGHVWQFAISSEDVEMRHCARCGQVEYLLGRETGWDLQWRGDGYCAEIKAGRP